MTTGNLYNLLGVSADASADDIKAAYHLAARRFHPDSNRNPGAADEFRQIAHAYAVLSDPNQRSQYDASVLAGGSGPLLAVHPVYSRQPLPAHHEPQVLYVLLEIQPSILTELPAPPMNLCLVVDRSTSMQGLRLDQVKAAAAQIIDSLRPSDTFAVVAFSDRPEVIVAPQASSADKTTAKARLSTLNAAGATEILQGLLAGLTELHRNLSPAAINHLMLLTDGRTYGDEADCLMLASLAATDGVVISGLGIGEEWNDAFLDELAARTGGAATYVHSAHNLARFLQNKVRGLSDAYAERVNVSVTLDPGVDLTSVFRLAPEPGTVPLDQPLRLGSLPKRQAAQVLFKFRLPPLSPGRQSVARLTFAADVISLGRRGERLVVDLALPVAPDPPPAAPPASIVEALSRLSQYHLQERAWKQAADGDLDGAIDRLKTLGTRLIAAGQPELGRLALSEATQLEKTRIMSLEFKKQLKYGTRGLLAAPRPTGLVR